MDGGRESVTGWIGGVLPAPPLAASPAASPAALPAALPAAALPAAELRLRLVGPMEAVGLDGRSVLPRTRKARALLALLALSAPDRVPRGKAAALLWSRAQREQARGSLRQALHELHDTLHTGGIDALDAGREYLLLDASRILVTDPAGADPDRLLEDLRDLDPAFDAWIAARIAERRLGAPRRSATLIASGRAPARAHGEIQGQIQGQIRGEIRGTALDGTQAAPAPAHRRLRIGVMPLRATDDGETLAATTSFGASLADELTAAFSRFRWLILRSGRSLGPFREGLPPDAAAALGIDFLLDGSVQRDAARIRVILQLHDLRAGDEVVWAQRYDRPAGDLLSLQDEIAAETVARLDPLLLLREGRRLVDAPQDEMTAQELVLSAIPGFYSLERAGFEAAGRTLARAVATAPEHAPAHAWLANWNVFLVGQGWAEDPEAAMLRAGALAEQAIRLDPSDARGLTIAGHVRAFMYRRVEEALLLHDQALELNANLPIAWVFSGLAHAYAGRHGEALNRINTARRLSPFDPYGFFYDMSLMLPLILRGEYEQAITVGRRAMTFNPSLSSTAKLYLAALGYAGTRREQAEVRDALLRVEPRFTIAAAVARTPLLLEQDRARYAEGLRRAGLPA
jgi:TolB-like protein